jgi:hypothetical protein
MAYRLNDINRIESRPARQPHFHDGEHCVVCDLPPACLWSPHEEKFKPPF